MFVSSSSIKGLCTKWEKNEKSTSTSLDRHRNGKVWAKKKKPFTKSLRCLLCTWTVTLSKHVTQYGPLYYNFKDPWLQNQKEEFWKLMRHIQSLYTFLLHFFLMFFQILIRRAMFFFLRIQILTAALLEITEVECSTNLEILAFSMVYAPNGLWNTACAKTLYLGASKHHQSTTNLIRKFNYFHKSLMREQNLRLQYMLKRNKAIAEKRTNLKTSYLLAEKGKFRYKQ